MEQICIICAIQQEIRPILRLFPATKVTNLLPFPAWQFEAFGNKVTLIRSGIGMSRARGAATKAAALKPLAIISAGFCGAISAGASVGEIFIAAKLSSFCSGSITSEITADPDFAEQIGAGLQKATFITIDKIIEKPSIATLLPDPAAINLLEMESACIAEICRAQGIKFAAIRSVSDTAENDPCMLFRRISDNDFNISVAKLILSLVKSPGTLPELVILWKNSRIAGRSLADAIKQTLERSGNHFVIHSVKESKCR